MDNAKEFAKNEKLATNTLFEKRKRNKIGYNGVFLIILQFKHLDNGYWGQFVMVF